jgi:two-component system, OmpR family, phosphate regulon response regulator PhoB
VATRNIDTLPSGFPEMIGWAKRRMTQRILLVEDEEGISTTLSYNLRQAGYQTTVASTGAAALDALKTVPRYDLVVLDLMLPDMSGKDICREIRRNRETERLPVIMVTAMGSEADRVVGFEVGADDYVVKPFSVRELLLRVRALLKRSETSGAVTDASIRMGILTITPDAHSVTVSGEETVLTALEFRLLHTLVERRGRVQSRGQLLSDVWGYSGDAHSRTVDTHMRRLRDKLGDAGAYIETIRGVGYCFRSPPRVEEA